MCIKGYSKKKFIYSEEFKALKKDILKHIEIGLKQIENKEYMTFEEFKIRMEAQLEQFN